MSKVILITGCSRGFGLLTAVACARRGGRVIATMRDTERRGALDEAARAAGVEVDVRELDVHLAESRGRCVDGVLADYGRVDVLVNNAGYAIFGAFEDVLEAEMRAVFDTNFWGAAELTRLVLPSMRTQGGGNIINISSAQGRAALPGFSAYDASKFALEGWSQALAHEVGQHGIRVCCVEPGSCKTDFSFASLERRAKLEGGPYARVLSAVERFMRPAFMARPEGVARRVARLCFRRRIPARLPVGLDTRMLLVAKAVLGHNVLRLITRTVLPALGGRPARALPPGEGRVPRRELSS